ncbi:MAG: Uncharacterised protein [SAR116 cluster bacterium]|jgi:hypothetical protein|nr:MAG: Uncharacterised protein [SAR116 cluster bacterium]
MGSTIGLYLVIGFILFLVIGIWAFGKLSVDPE